MDKVDLLAAKYDQAIRALRFYDEKEDTDIVNQLTDLIVLSRTEKWEKHQFYKELVHFFFGCGFSGRWQSKSDRHTVVCHRIVA